MINKIVVAPDSFKESMSSMEACYEISQGLISGFKRPIEIITIPMADGGEGTCEVLMKAKKAKRIECEAQDAYQNKIKTYYGYNEETKIAIIETALICGLESVPVDRRNPINASSYGVGEVINNAVLKGAKKIIIGLGGSATNDGGLGMLTSLGAKFYNNQKEEIAVTLKNINEIHKMDITNIERKLNGIELIVASDVENVYIGNNGATYTFGRQKGATVNQIEFLEKCLVHIHNIVENQFRINLSKVPKTGAAGGMAGALYLIGAELVSGIDLVLKETVFIYEIQTADLIITGEGSIDSQTIHGKTISGIAKIAKQYNIPVIALGGRVTSDIDELYNIGVSSVFSITNEAKSLDKALNDGKYCLRETAKNLAKLLVIFK